MDTDTLNRLLQKCLVTRRYYWGCYPANRIPRPHQTPASIVVNEDVAGEPGSHWIGLFLRSPTHIYYFDSYGMPPNEHISKYLLDFPKISKNDHIFQDIDSNVCGHYVIYFIYFASLGYTMEQIVRSLLKNVNVDSFVLEFVNKNVI